MQWITESGAVALLNRLVDNLPTTFHLYINDVPGSYSAVLTDFVEASWPDYRRKFDKIWSPALWINNAAYSWTDQKVWTRGSGGLPVYVYGYYVTIGRPRRLLWFEPREAGPVPMIHSFDCVTILPQISYRGVSP